MSRCCKFALTEELSSCVHCLSACLSCSDRSPCCVHVQPLCPPRSVSATFVGSGRVAALVFGSVTKTYRTRVCERFRRCDLDHEHSNSTFSQVTPTNGAIPSNKLGLVGKGPSVQKTSSRQRPDTRKTDTQINDSTLSFLSILTSLWEGRGGSRECIAIRCQDLMTCLNSSAKCLGQWVYSNEQT